jgi:hypothetical protein
MADKETLHKEIDLIQGIINRMANNSFLLKGWLVSLIAVIIALEKDVICEASLILIVPTLAFWYLDAFFLHKERCYRKLYDWVIENRMNTDKYLYNLDYKRFNQHFCNSLFSKTLMAFYGVVMLVLIGIIIYKSLF